MQVYMFARMYCEGESYADAETRDSWLKTAAVGASFLDKAKTKEGGQLFFSVTATGSKIRFQRKPYAGVFYSMGCLQYFDALRLYESLHGGKRLAEEIHPKEFYLDSAVDMYDRVLKWMEDPAACGAHPESGPDDSGLTSALAQLMCVASMRLELAEKLKGTKYEDRIQGLLSGMGDTMAALKKHVYTTPAGNKVFLEAVNEREGVDLKTPAGRLFLPGHSIEVAWFLYQMTEAVPGDNSAMASIALDVVEGSLREGWDAEEYGGGMLYMMDIEGRPMVDCTVTAQAKLWWPHTEALIALTLAMVRTGDEGRWMPWLRKVHEYSYKWFADKEGGEWWGYCDRDGKKYSDAKGGNYKGCFHLPRALLMCAQFVEGDK